MVWFYDFQFNQTHKKLPDKGDPIVRHILTNSLKDSEDSIAGLAVLAVWGVTGLGLSTKQSKGKYVIVHAIGEWEWGGDIQDLAIFETEIDSMTLDSCEIPKQSEMERKQWQMKNKVNGFNFNFNKVRADNVPIPTFWSFKLELKTVCHQELLQCHVCRHYYFKQELGIFW